MKDSGENYRPSCVKKGESVQNVCCLICSTVFSFEEQAKRAELFPNELMLHLGAFGGKKNLILFECNVLMQ